MATSTSCLENAPSMHNVFQGNRSGEEQTRFTDKCAELVRMALTNSCKQELHRTFGMADRSRIVVNLLDMQRLSDEESGEALALAIKTPYLFEDARSQIIERLNTASISPIHRGMAVCVAAKMLDRKTVENLLRKGLIPERKDSVLATDRKKMSCCWQDAVNIALEKNAKSILEALFACEGISTDTRCQAVYDAFDRGYRGRLESLLSFVPNGGELRRRLVLKAARDGYPGVADELTD
jgi:hypothetical protein